MQIPNYVGFVSTSEIILREAYLQVSERHQPDADVRDGCRKMAAFGARRIESVAVLRTEFGSASAREPELVRNALFRGVRVGGLGVLRDLHDLSVLANQALLYWIELYQAFRAIHESSAEVTCRENILGVEREVAWLTTQIKNAAPQALTVAPDRLTQTVTVVKKIPTTAVLPDYAGPSLKRAAILASAGIFGFVLGRRRRPNAERGTRLQSDDRSQKQAPGS
jgi:hypothetical protein